MCDDKTFIGPKKIFTVHVVVWCSSLTCFRNRWMIPRNACSSHSRRYRHSICWPRRNLCATIYSQWSAHNLKIIRERFFTFRAKYRSNCLTLTNSCNRNIWLFDDDGLRQLQSEREKAIWNARRWSSKNQPAERTSAVHKARPITHERPASKKSIFSFLFHFALLAATHFLFAKRICANKCIYFRRCVQCTSATEYIDNSTPTVFAIVNVCTVSVRYRFSSSHTHNHYRTAHRTGTRNRTPLRGQINKILCENSQLSSSTPPHFIHI